MKSILKTLTLDEKINLLTGKNLWELETANGKLPQLRVCDGPHGVNKIVDNKPQPATAMPNLMAIANSWDPELAYLDGETIGDECIQAQVDVLLAPGVNIKRTPLCGRNFEYFSEDPYLTGVLAKAFIEGVQSKGIGASLKHFALNNREYDRMWQSSEVDERTFHEIYLPAFEIAVEAKPWTVMCSYNPVNGVWASENEYLLKDVLRGELGFDGLIISDWESVHHSARALKATLDLRMPYRKDAYEELTQALQEGWITEEEIDVRVEKVLELLAKKTAADSHKKAVYTKEQRHENALKIAKECIVLLKNEENILPLSKETIAMTGSSCYRPPMGGGGSGYVTTEYEPRTLYEELNERMGENLCKIAYYYNRADNSHNSHMSAIFEEARNAEKVVLCVSTNQIVEGESFDRTTIRLNETQENLIINTAKYNPNIIVVVYAGSAIDMSAWIDKVKAVVFAGFLGEGAQEAVADILTGKANPSGKLSETFPLCIEDTPTGLDVGNNFVEKYTEGVLVGYRYYDTKGKAVLFPFGHGLSYSSFAYSDLKVEAKTQTDYNVSFTVTNTSNVDGKEVAQVYVRDIFATVERPDKELKGFTKIHLKAGESKRVCIALNARSFAFWSQPRRAWYVENGAYEILVGSSSRDIRLMQEIKIDLPANKQSSRPFEDPTCGPHP